MCLYQSLRKYPGITWSYGLAWDAGKSFESAEAVFALGTARKLHGLFIPPGWRTRPGRGVMLQMVPLPFIRIQLGAVGRQEKQPQPAGRDFAQADLEFPPDQVADQG